MLWYVFRCRQATLAVCYMPAGQIKMGWSYFNQNDKYFTRKAGREIAIARLNGVSAEITVREEKTVNVRGDLMIARPKVTVKVQPNDNIPRLVEKALDGFERRCKRYFRSDKNNTAVRSGNDESHL